MVKLKKTFWTPLEILAASNNLNSFCREGFRKGCNKDQMCFHIRRKAQRYISKEISKEFNELAKAVYKQYRKVTVEIKEVEE